MGHLAFARMVLGVAMMMSMISMVPTMAMFAAFDRARERVRRMLLMQRMLRAIHKPDVALVRQHEAQRHAERDGNAQKPAVPREGQHASFRNCCAKA